MDRHIAAVLRTEVEARGLRQATLLDAGCGSGRLLAHLGRHQPRENSLKSFGFDIPGSAAAQGDFPTGTYELLRRELPDVDWGDRIRGARFGDPWPFDDETFDIVVSNQVLEHVRDPKHFLLENYRVLRRGGFAVHVFPLRNYLVEGHTRMPLVHKIRSWDLRRAAFFSLASAGMGDFRVAADATGIDEPSYAETRADFVDFETHYLTWSRVHELATYAGLRASPRYTPDLYFSKARSLLRLPVPESYGRHAPLRDALGLAVFRYAQGVTLFLERPLDPEGWARPRH